MNNYDRLKTNTDHFMSDLHERQAILDALEKDILEELKRLPEGSLYVRSRHGKPYYYESTQATKSRRRTDTYIRKNDISKAYGLAKREYLEEVLPAVRKEKLKLDSLGSLCRPDEITNHLSPGKLNLIRPLYQSDEEYIAAWVDTPYFGLGFRDDDPSQFFTSTGIRVRSKAEILIADRLSFRGIPYRYECPLIINGRKLYPDFTCLHVRDRRVVIIEHLGMLSDPEYLKTAIRKINLYEKAGFRQGIDIIYTFESATEALDMASFDALLRSHLL